ncbi:hypothetical protein O181_015964 [Austropuccinia psidii MF-1]|uniref:Uncharacterized protein n=1 Tax=Austropuccinia psidii MF-1 TaxID=1389203 RepID=A0A9Q3C0U3_9BASI|nr:hypothetical protein [Austropuccinia psidii MF-1]
MAYINGTATKITVCIDNAQYPLIIESGAHHFIVANDSLDGYFPNWERQLFKKKANNLKIASGKMTSIGTLIKEIIIPHRKGNIRLNPGFEDAHIQELLLGTDYQRIYGIGIYNSKNRHITIGTNKEKKFAFDIYQMSTHDPLEELINEFREAQFSTSLTSKQKLSFLKMMGENIPEFSIGEQPMAKIRWNNLELYLDVGRLYSPMLRRPPYPASLETKKGVERHINELQDMYFIRKIGHNERV